MLEKLDMEKPWGANEKKTQQKPTISSQRIRTGLGRQKTFTK